MKQEGQKALAAEPPATLDCIEQPGFYYIFAQG